MSRALTAPVGATGTHARRRCAASRCSSSGPTARWTRATRCDASVGKDGNGSNPRPARVRAGSRPDAGGGDARAHDEENPRCGAGPSRRRTAAGAHRRGEGRDEELRERAAAAVVAELAEAVRRVRRGQYKPAQAAYAELKAVPDGVDPRTSSRRCCRCARGSGCHPRRRASSSTRSPRGRRPRRAPAGSFWRRSSLRGKADARRRCSPTWSRGASADRAQRSGRDRVGRDSFNAFGLLPS